MLDLYCKLKKVLGNELAALDIAGQMYGQSRRVGQCSYYQVLIDRRHGGEAISENQLDYALSVDMQLSEIDFPISVGQAEEKRVVQYRKILDRAIEEKTTSKPVKQLTVAAIETDNHADCLPGNLENERLEFKQRLMAERGFSNFMAEKFLDQQGWERPAGWHSVFFFPGSMKMRGSFVAILGVTALIFLLVV